ncbi:alpha/beta hydrolase [Arsukibacterium sp.]|uniref:alpha/beta hydrolase n=1 Tax=Arsukibacterium sp. TaxID=1977258 RepID=UPI00299D5463|nr:alpha/beta fold hydrolase [Arsukibacterium sp.]MDX1678879.1 alpha/beta fold hydrolase [Arsukibacterium sp.]
MRNLLTIVVYLVAGYGLLCLVLYLLQRQLIYFPVPAELPAADPLVLKQPNATVLISQRPLNSKQALLYFGGNAEDVSVSLPEFAAAFAEHAIYLMHYRGYGGSSGSPSEQALVADALALFDTLQHQHRQFTVIGRSLGTGVAVQLAARRPVSQLVLITPFDSLTAVARQQMPYIPVSWLLQDRFESHYFAADISCPVLLLVAEQDDIIKAERSEALYRAFKADITTLIRYPGNHNSALPAKQIAAWLDADN